MATSGLERIKGDLECPMCLEIFKDPVTLNCGHSFCRKCLNNYIRAHATAVTRKILPCSVCRHETNVPDPSQPMEHWMNQLKPSFTIKNLVEHVNTSEEIRDSDARCFPSALWCSRRKRSLTIKCPQHNEVLKYHCRDCRKSICNTCMLLHSTCEDVVTLDSMIGEMKLSISQKHQKATATLNEKRDNLTKLKSSFESMKSRHSITVSKIRTKEKGVITCVKEKFQKDVDKANKLAEEETSLLKEEIKAAEKEVKIFEKHSTTLKKVLEADNSDDIYKTRELCQSGSLFPEADPDGHREKHLVDMDYILDLESIEQILSKFGEVKLTYDGEEKRTTEASATLVRPVLTSQINAATQGDDMGPDLIALTVMIVHGVEAVIVTDFLNKRVKCFLSTPQGTSRRTSSSTVPSVCQLEGGPDGITQLKDNRVMVAVPYKNQLVTLRVTPALVIENTTKTQEEYRFLEMMDNGQLVASAVDPGRVDVLDVNGDTATKLRSLPIDSLMFEHPWCLTKNRQDGHIIVSDHGTGTVTTMTSEGDITWRYSLPEGTEFFPRAVSTTKGGDVIVVDVASRKIIVLTRSGIHKTDLLTLADAEFSNPWGAYYDDRGFLYVTDATRILIYNLGNILKNVREEEEESEDDHKEMKQGHFNGKTDATAAVDADDHEDDDDDDDDSF